MRKKARTTFAREDLVRVRRNNDFTAGVESQTFPLPTVSKLAAEVCDHNQRDCWRTHEVPHSKTRIDLPHQGCSLL
jgi:hypothetical protein